MFCLFFRGLGDGGKGTASAYELFIQLKTFDSVFLFSFGDSND